MFNYVKQLRLSAMLLLVLAVAPASATAISREAVVAALPKATAVAEAYWGPDACDGRVRVELLSRVDLFAIRGDEADGQAVLDTCLIQVAWGRDTSRTVLCALMVHERGHLHGKRYLANIDDPFHSLDSASIMFAGVGDAPRACMEEFQPYLVRRLRGAGRRCWPLTSEYGWRCARVLDAIPAI